MWKIRISSIESTGKILQYRIHYVILDSILSKLVPEGEIVTYTADKECVLKLIGADIIERTRRLISDVFIKGIREEFLGKEFEVC